MVRLKLMLGAGKIGRTMLIDFIAAIVPKPAIKVPDSGTALSLLTMAMGAIAFIRAKLK